ncbi:hypothetical protein PIB30_049699 [Stylosanthes scabra]|uniref:Methyltransferase PMT27 n=1 Tax=Stylosanthes scabra TaxID=79078 RepID=A0ABU6ZG82_9FABA|nr:hypothetical protein [Stylosanthes scabra]
MALFKSRNTRRSSSSYVPTFTIFLFIALCIFGVWMLTSNSDEQTTSTRTAIDTTDTETSNADLSSSLAADDTPETTTSTDDNKRDTLTPVFGDNPGHLPEDAIKSGDHKHNQQTTSIADSQISEESSLTQKEQADSASSLVSDAASDIDNKLQQPATNLEDGISAKPTQDSHNADTLQQQDVVKTFENPVGKNEDDDPNREQLKEDKGDIAKTEQVQESAKRKGESSPEAEEAETDGGEGAKKRKKKKKKKEKAWSTQADESKNENKRQKGESSGGVATEDQRWQLCNTTAGADYIPCLDNVKAIKSLRSTKHFEHRERHCPEDAPTCLVPLPQGYKKCVAWPNSRDKIWYHNVPHVLLAQVKGHQNWVKVSGEYLTFPGGGTQFIHGALHYIDFLQQAEAGIGWGKHTRVILDVGCGVGSFGGFLFERDVIAMSFAPKDEHEAQVQFALERGIPAISAVMGSQRLPFPSRAFDLVHCARCRVPWHADGGMLLLELNRVLRPGGYFVWSATPVYQKLQQDVEIWEEMTALTKSMCWELVTINKDELNRVGAAFYRKPTSNKCYEQREQNQPPLCKDDDDPNAAWYVPLQACMHKVPVKKAERGAKWPEAWPARLHKTPYWLNDSQTGIYGKPASQDFAADNDRWKNVVDELSNAGITWSGVRNVMDMRAVYGGFAAALKDLPVWVFNVVNIDAPDTLPIIYERGLFGIYHDWCESFSTYPRTYDILHADHLFSKLKERCNLVPVMAEVDRILRPEGRLIVRDEASSIGEIEALIKSLQWEITASKKQEGFLCAKKGHWRPDGVASS